LVKNGEIVIAKESVLGKSVKRVSGRNEG
jgi:hypothetical protein